MHIAFFVNHIYLLDPLITVLNLVKRFPGIVQDGETDMLVEQFSDYQLAPVQDLPSCVKDDNIEQFLGEMVKLDDIFSGTKRFGVLSKLAKLY